MGVRTGNRVDLCTDDYTGNCRAVVEVFIETFVETIVRLPSILVLRVSRALELRIGLRAELRAELQGGDPLGLPCALRALFHCVARTPSGQRCCKAFGIAFGRAFAELW